MYKEPLEGYQTFRRYNAWGELMKVSLVIIFILSIASCFTQNLLNQPESIVYDQINDRYLVSNFGDGSIVAINNVGEQSYFSTELTRLAALYIYEEMLLAASNLDPYVGLVGFDLNTDEMILFIPIFESALLNDITSDNQGYVYITDYWDTKIFKVDIQNQNYWIYAVDGLQDPNGIIFDEINNRLITTSTFSGTWPLLEVSLADSSVNVLVNTYISSQDGLARDNEGNYYFSSWYYNACFRFDPQFSEPAEIFSENHSGPADIYCDNVNNLLCIPNFNSNTVELIPIDLIVAEDVEIPEAEIEMCNYPNPFNPSTVISFQVSDVRGQQDVELGIYNIKGQKIKTYKLNDIMPVTLSEVEGPTGIPDIPNSLPFDSAQGDRVWESRSISNQYSITWNGTDNNGNEVPSGVYFYKISTNKVEKTKKMILLR
jgi:sugar lactone lactonase YvrE